MTERPADRRSAPLWTGTVRIRRCHYFDGPVGVAVRAQSAHVAARLAIATVRAKLPARSRVKGFVLTLERQPAAKVEP